MLRLRNTDLEGELVGVHPPDVKKTLEEQKTQGGIETYRAGMPGQERLMANTKQGEQLGVRPFEGGAVLDIERTLVGQSEEEARETAKEHDNVEEKGQIARDAIDETAEKTKDLSKLIRSLEEKKNSLLLVDPETIKNPLVPREGLQLLVKEEEGNDLRPSLENFGYQIEDIEGGVGMVAKKGDSQFVFQYASERPVKASGEQGFRGEESDVQDEEIKNEPLVGEKKEKGEQQKRETEQKEEGDVTDETAGKKEKVSKKSEEDVEDEAEEPPSLEALQERAEEQGGFVLYVEGKPDVASLGGSSDEGLFLADGSSLEHLKKDATAHGSAVYGFRIRGDAKIADVVDKSVRDFSPADRKKFAQKYDLIRFEDEEGRTEYVLLRKNAVEETGGGAE